MARQTAQVASQQGTYLGKKLSMIAVETEGFSPDDDDPIYKPFVYRQYVHPLSFLLFFPFPSHNNPHEMCTVKSMGSLAYIGNSAVFDLNSYSFAGGLVAMYLWRSVYWSEQVSFRNRVLLMLDWIKRGVWGRDLSKVRKIICY